MSHSTLPLQDRVLAAKAMIERLKTTERVGIIDEMETLCDAYINLANWPVDKYKKETSKLYYCVMRTLTWLTGRSINTSYCYCVMRTLIWLTGRSINTRRRPVSYNTQTV